MDKKYNIKLNPVNAKQKALDTAKTDEPKLKIKLKTTFEGNPRGKKFA